MLEDVDRLVLHELKNTSENKHENSQTDRVQQVTVSDNILREFSSRIYKHEDDDLWSYFEDNTIQEYWNMAFARLLEILGNHSHFYSSADLRGRMKAFEFALKLPALLKEVEHNSLFPSTIAYRISMKADLIHSFLDAGEESMKLSYLSLEGFTVEKYQ